MKKNVSKLLATAMVAGFLAGSTVVSADHHDKAKHPGKKETKGAKKGKSGCESKEGKGDCAQKEEHGDHHEGEAKAE